MNQRKAGALLSYAHIIVTTAISLIYTPYMLRMMGQSEYGLYGSASSFVSYLSVLSFGIGGSYIRFNAIARAKGDKSEEDRLNGMYLTIFSVLALLVLIGGVLMELLAGSLVKNTFSGQELYKLRVIMAILIANTMLSFICNVFMMALQAYEEYLFIRITLLSAAVLQPILNVIALQRGGRAITITAISFIVSLLSYLLFFIHARKAIRFRFSFRGFRKDVLKEIAVFSGFLFLNSVTDQITFSTDSVILSATKGAAAVAVYNVGGTFKSFFMQLSTAVSTVFVPKVNQIVANREDPALLDEVFIRVGRIQFYVVALILIGYCSVGQSFVRMWAGPDYGDSFYIGLLLMLAIAVPLFQNIGMEIQKAKNKHKARSIAYFLISVFNVLLTIPLARRWGGIGAAFATTVCMFLGTVVFMNYYYARHIGLDIKAFWKSIGSIVPGLVPVIAAGALIHRLVPIASFRMFFAMAALLCLVYFVSVWFLSMNEYEKGLVRTLTKRWAARKER